MTEKGRPATHPDLMILNGILPAHRGINGLGKDNSDSPIGLVFTEPGRSFWDHYNRIADGVDEGKNLVFLLAGTKEGVKMGRRIARGLVEVGLTSTEFTTEHLVRAGYRQFVGGFSFRFVNPLRIT